MTDFESLFLQAEAVQRGIYCTVMQKLFMRAAVTQSIIYMGGAGGTCSSCCILILLRLGKPLVNFDVATNKLQTIITQKWMCIEWT